MNGKDNDNGYDDDDVLWVLDAEGGGFEAWGFWRLGCTHRGRTRFVRAKRQWHHIGRSVTLKLHIYICECDLAVQSESVAKQWDIWGIHFYIIINSLLKRIITKRITYLKENKTQFNGTKIEDIRLKCPTIYICNLERSINGGRFRSHHSTCHTPIHISVRPNIIPTS